MSFPSFRLTPVVLALLACAHAQAQSQQTIVITGNPLGRAVGTQAASVLAGDALLQRRAGTLGETLDGLPGVAATGFGPNASRPVIRGLDGDRVRLLDNGGSSVDASNLSFDHASAADPLVAERVEVLRGPAALLYGGNATGGVVNSIDNRIPRAPALAFSGRAEVRLGGAAAEKAGAAVLEGGAGRWAWHADAFGRNAEDQRVPRYTPVEGGEALEATSRVRNSAARSEGGALGGGWVSDQGFLGMSADTARQHYGVTAEPDVFIRMKRDRLALAGEWRSLQGPLSQVSVAASHSRYRHEEVEGTGEVGTTFESRGDELRLQAQHAPLGGLRGVVGLQLENMDFSALGEEAFVPGTRTRSSALFALEQWQAGALALSAGARLERVRVASEGDTDPSAAPPGGRFGAAMERRFNPSSLLLGATWGGHEGWLASATLGRTERAPAYYELYANGLHVATAAYERGDTGLPSERSRHAELGLAFRQGAHTFSLNLFDTRFSRYLSLDASGQSIPTDEGDVPEYRFSAVRARLRGAELEGRTRLLAGPVALDLNASLDTVRGDNLDSGQPLPRLAPLRARLGLEARQDGWRVGAGLRASARQSRVPATDTATPGFTMLDLWAGGAVPALPQTSWFARLNNATDKLARSAGTIATLRGLAPLPGRALSVGLRTVF